MRQTKLVAILNITPDSFSDGGHYIRAEDSVSAYHKLLDEGADFVDIGAQSTSYGAKVISVAEEIERLKPVITSIKDHSQTYLDSFNYDTISFAFDNGVKNFNDVSCASDPRVLNLIANNKECKYVLMLSLCIPADKRVRLGSLSQLLELANRSISHALDHGISHDQLILDPGIGFTSDSDLSMELIRNPQSLYKFDLPIYYGHSRKSMLTNLTTLPPHERDVETLAVSVYLRRKVDFLRVHNIGLHSRFFKASDLISNQ